MSSSESEREAGKNVVERANHLRLAKRFCRMIEGFSVATNTTSHYQSRLHQEPTAPAEEAESVAGSPPVVFISTRVQ